jgi:hypothetical protein
MDDDYMSSEWTSLLGPDDDPSWADWQKIWEAEAAKASKDRDYQRMEDCRRRAEFCAKTSKKADGHDEHV